MAITKINTPELFDLGATNSSLQLPSGNTASRPSNPSTGEWRYNTDDNKVEYWDGSAWFQIDYEASAVTPTSNFQTVTYTGNGSTQTIDSKFDMAADFNGSSSVIDIPQGNLPIGSAARTISFWINTTQTTGVELFSYGTLSNNTYCTVNLNQNSSGQIGMAFFANDHPFSAPTINNGNWHHVCAVYDGNIVTLYLDGSSLGNSTAGAVNTSSAGSPKIGSTSFKGKLDQFRIFNTALNLTQVGELYNDETADTASVLNFPTGAGCIAAYQFNGNPADVGGTYGGVATDIGYTGLEFQPDLVWIKKRSGTATLGSHILHDSVRGATYSLYSDLPNQQQNTNAISSFDSNGFTIGTSYDGTNGSGNDIVAWCWKAGGAAVLNEQGDIDSQVSANPDAGFSIVKWTGDGNASSTVGHGLSSKAELIIQKTLSTTGGWFVVSSELSNNEYLALQATIAATTDAGSSGAPASVNNNNDTTFGFRSGSSNVDNVNKLNDNYIAYCFHSVQGYSKIGSYTGNGSASGPIVETGFEPAFLMIKRTDASGGNWVMLDNKRAASLSNIDKWLKANTANADDTGANVSFNSNGFNLNLTNANFNASGGTYIYLAIAANPKPAPVLANSFDISLYTGNGGTQNVYSSLSPDLVWMKSRGGTIPDWSHAVNDSVRGADKTLSTNSTTAESTVANGLLSFDTNGFTLGSAGGSFNYNGSTYVAWQWKAAGIPTINTDGTITSLVNANPNAGFSIVGGSGNTFFGGSLGHGLSQAPEFIIYKDIDNSNNWYVYHKDLTNPNNYFLYLDTADKQADYGSNIWNVTSTTFGSNLALTRRGIAYCFHSVDGYQKVGSYSGGSSGSGNVIYTTDDGTSSGSGGFKPRFLIVKRTDQAGDAWQMLDSTRGGGDTFDNYVQANNSDAEVSYNQREVNFTNNGFYWTYAESGTNISGGTYIYLAIA